MHTFVAYIFWSSTPPKVLAPSPVQLKTARAVGKSDITLSMWLYERRTILTFAFSSLCSSL